MSETAVEGPVCESTDSLGRHRLPPLVRGDLVVIRDAGAYGASLGSSYNGRPRPPQVLLEEDGAADPRPAARPRPDHPLRAVLAASR